MIKRSFQTIFNRSLIFSILSPNHRDAKLQHRIDYTPSQLAIFYTRVRWGTCRISLLRKIHWSGQDLYLGPSPLPCSEANVLPLVHRHKSLLLAYKLYSKQCSRRRRWKERLTVSMHVIHITLSTKLNHRILIFNILILQINLLLLEN